MTIYILNLLMIGLYSYFYNLSRSHLKINIRTKKVFIILVTLQLILVLSFRHFSIGVDLTRYVNYFKFVFPTYNLEQLMEHRHEIGYKLLNVIIGLFTNNEQIFISIIAIISIAPIGRFIYKYSKMPFLSFALYISMNYYSFAFSGLRQSIAYAIIFRSYDFIKEKNFSKFILCVIFAASFHKSALVFLPAYFLANLKLKKSTITGIVLVDIILFVFRRQFFLVLSSLFYDDYEVVVSSSFTWLILCSLIVISGLFFYKSVVAISQDNNVIYIFLIVGASIMIFASMGTNVMRVADYYYMFVILFIPEIINVIKGKASVVAIGYFLMPLIFLLYIWFLQGDGFGIVPYKFFWQ